ncbi:MAG TPA: cob(I)yrinic acid a,c-diamide adenosyltransferase [Candidatus Paceibacterota bacterium]
MGLFYTGKGDKGKSLICGKKIDKTCCEMEALGHLDELNSLLGLIRSYQIQPQFQEGLKGVQENLFIIQANLAVIMLGKKFKAPEFPHNKITGLETVIDVLEKEIQPEKKFVISGENQQAAWFDYARTVCRRAERETLRLAKKKKINPDILAYLNRLSGFLFACARYESKIANIKEHNPTYR